MVLFKRIVSMPNSIKHALIVSLSLFAAVSAAQSEDDFSGVTTMGNLSVWRVNHLSGAVALCSFEGHRNQPLCYPWSAGEKQGSFDIIAGNDVLSTWRINRATGDVSLCEYKEVDDPPECTPWSN